MKKIIKRYKFVFIIIIFNLIMLLLKPDIGMNSIETTAVNLKEMLCIMPPVFLLIGILDVWVERETMIKIMGNNSGIVGIVIAFLLGSIAAGPVYVAFPFAGVLLKKGTKFSNVIIFLGAWSATKIPISLFEASVLGWKFMLIRYALDIPVLLLIAFITDKVVSKKEKDMIYEKAKNLD
ncbi:permease [Anaerosacchariphilus polymeriproducens]|uniref:Permease n=1 Tax=Anaerosacchariphilus polymeriproducens TaxID=1812858 RepID=A0A371AXV7_9FIRM|nr:permease [Anaerosacchariphilus polymeriproducens]RDU24408.1 permease [Anaerosacchariphilus polymeriproducens]